jgi:hypothetical protein
MTGLTLALSAAALLATAGWIIAAYEARRLRESRDRWRQLCVDQSDEWVQSASEMARLVLGKPKAKRASDWGSN